MNGWLILVSGFVGLISTVMTRKTPGLLWSLASAVLGVVVGIILLSGPVLEDVSLTLVLVVFFTIEGVAWSFYALDHKNNLSGPWSWMLVSGIVDLLLAFVIFCRLPVTEAWTFGLIVGVSMMFGGCAMIAMASHARGPPLARGQRTNPRDSHPRCQTSAAQHQVRPTAWHKPDNFLF